MLLTPIPKNCDPSVRRAFQKINNRLDPHSTPTFAEVHATGAVTAYEGRDILRYAVMMATISRRDH